MKGSFFCEACGAEVKGKADKCPQCGRSFLGIRCPRCGKDGSSADFVKGCPDCGFMAQSDDRQPEEERLVLRKRRSLRKPLPTAVYLLLSGVILALLGLILYIWT